MKEDKPAVLDYANESLYGIHVTKTWLIHIGIDDLRSALFTKILRIAIC